VNLDFLFTGRIPPHIDDKMSDDVSVTVSGGIEDEDPEIAELMSMTLETLKSDTNYSKSLSGTIRALYDAAKTEKRLNGMEAQLQKLVEEHQELVEDHKEIKERLKRSDRIRSEDPEENRGEILKIRAL
jgi:hypothetical protein